MRDESQTAIENLIDAGLIGEITFSGAAADCPCAVRTMAA